MLRWESLKAGKGCTYRKATEFSYGDHRVWVSAFVMPMLGTIRIKAKNHPPLGTSKDATCDFGEATDLVSGSAKIVKTLASAGCPTEVAESYGREIHAFLISEQATLAKSLTEATEL